MYLFVIAITFVDINKQFYPLKKASGLVSVLVPLVYVCLILNIRYSFLRHDEQIAALERNSQSVLAEIASFKHSYLVSVAKQVQCIGYMSVVKWCRLL